MNAVVFIPLTRGQVAVVDFVDFERVRGIRWHAFKRKRSWYAASSVWVPGAGQHRALMHRKILGAAREVDHRDGDGLNNTRENLRACSHSENCANVRAHKDGSSSFKGVGWCKGRNCWQAQIQVRGHKKHLGRFKSEREAALAYDAAARRFFGAFARVSFP